MKRACLKKTFKALSPVVIGLLLFCGCSKEAPKQIRQPAPQASKTQKGVKPPENVASAPQQEAKLEAESYIYDPKGRRDPFLSIIEAAKKDRDVEKKKKGLKPSEAYEVGEIKVIAIASDRKNRYAMVQFPDNKYFTVREGTTLGRFGGKVVNISPEGIVVREYVKNYRGETQAKDTQLKLRKEEGE